MKLLAIFETEPLPSSILVIAGEFVALQAGPPAACDNISSLALQIFGGLPNFPFSTASANNGTSAPEDFNDWQQVTGLPPSVPAHHFRHPTFKPRSPRGGAQGLLCASPKRNLSSSV